MSGYARIHRTLLGHAAFRNDAEAMAFAWLVVRAAWAAGEVRYKSRAVSLERGQIATSVRDFAEAMDRDKGWVERLLKRLRNCRMIETDAKTGFLVVTICNYSEYQSDGEKRKTPAKTPKKTNARQTQDTDKEGEKREEEETPQPPAGGRRGKHVLPEDWVLPTVEELPPQAKACARQWKPQSYAAHGEAFVNFWRPRGRMMTDWRLTWAGRVVEIHEKVLRAEKFDQAPPATAEQRKPMTAFETENAIRFARSQGNDAHAAELQRQLERMRPSPVVVPFIPNMRASR